MQYLHALPAFVTYFSSAALCMFLFVVTYIHVTPYNEHKEIHDNHNPAASIALVGAMIGFAIPEASLLIHAVGLADFFIWSAVALLVQLFAFVCSLVYDVRERIIAGDMSVGIMLAGISIVAGILNAACLTY